MARGLDMNNISSYHVDYQLADKQLNDLNFHC